MTELELDIYLRESPMPGNYSQESESANKRAGGLPFFSDNRMQPDIFDEDHFLRPGQNIAFYMHPRRSGAQRHRHSFIELIYVYSGECRQIINDNEVTMHQGEICILDTNTVHSIEKTGREDIIINCLMRKSYFNAAFLGRLSGNDIFTGFFVRSIYQSKDFNEYILLHSAGNEKISRLMKNILCEYFDKNMCSDEVIDSYMIILFAELLRVYRNDVNRQNYAALKNTLISDVIKYVQNNCGTATLESTAKHFNFDAGYLSKAIKKLTGIRFMDLVHQARLGQACMLLRSTDIPINVVANEVGYENISFFYQIFKRYYGCSPADYRKSRSGKMKSKTGG